MKQVALGRTGETVSEFCLGCMMMGTAMDEASSFEVLDHFFESGGDFVDTANCYAWWMGKGEFIGDESENVLGRWMKTRKNRSDVFLATKVGARLKDPYNIRDANGDPEWGRVRSEYEGLSASVIRKGVEDSLRRLGTDYIDLYYTHVFDERTPLEETMKVLDKLVKEGKVRFIGCSNIITQQIRRANEICEREGFISYAAMQQEFSYLHPIEGADTGITAHGDSEMFSFAEESGMAFLAYSPLLKGIYSDRAKREQYYNWHLYDSEYNRKKLDLVEAVSSRLGVSGNQLVLAWMLRREPRIIPILGFSRKEQYYENITAADIALSDEVMDELNAME
jgi:aryl-alcohol dehydrogenase-like predicted oxidoreductase